MANLRKIIYINEEDYSTLINGDSLVIDGTTYTYEENALYVIKNAGPPEYAETAGYATNAGTSLVAITDASGNNIAATYGKKPLIIEVEDGDTEVPSGTFDSITGALNNGSRVIIKFISGDEYNTDIYYLPLTLYILCYTFEALIYKKYIWIEIDKYNNVSINNYNVSDDANVIHLNTTETITGNKTFSGTVSLGSNATATTPAATDNDTSVATTAFVHNVVNAEQVQADWNLTTTTAKDYIKNKPNITKTSNGNWDYLNINEEIINLNTNYAAYYNNKEIAVKDDIPSEIITGQIVGRMHRDNVSGTGNLTIAGASGEGFSPTGITTAGKYVVVVYSWSDTKTFGYNISFGSNSYTLSTTDGTISDKRELTVSAGALWSGSVTTAVSAGTTIIVEIYKAEKTTPALSVGTVALTNLYNDLDGKPIISDSTSSTSSTDIASSKAVKLAYDHGGVQSVNGQTGAVNVNIPIINAVTETYSSTAADTTTPFSASIWRVDLSDKITELYTGLTILIKVPVAGNGTYGTLLRIDGTDSADDTSENLYPVCANVTTMISTRYAVDCIIPLTFDATQAGQTLYYNSASAYTTTASGTGWTKPGCWKIADYSTGDTTTGREGYYYMRPYAGQAVYRYKYLMEGADGRLYPIVTTNQTNGTSVTKTPTTVGLRPWKIWYYNHTDTVSAGAAFGALRVYPELYTTTATYNFNASTGTYAWIFLLGSYNKDTDLFTLDTGNNYYKFVRYNAAINWASSLTAGKYYILLGSSYSTTNYVLLYNVNPFYYFNGTNLIPVTTKIALDSGPVTSVNGLTGNVNLTLGDTNVIESISVNGVAQTVTDKNVDITIEVPEGELSENYATSELENENLMLAAGDTFETAFSKVEKAIIDNEETVAGALNDLNERLLDIDVPSSVSDLTDDVGIIKSITLNSNTYTPTNGVVDLGTITGTGTGEANIIESVKVNGTALTVTNKAVDITSIPASILTGTIPNNITATTQNQNDNSTKIATTAYVDTAIDNIPNPMIFKGSLGTGGTITALPTAATSNEGYTYKVITNGTYGGQSAKIGDTFISDGTLWIYIPSGDEPSGTVTSVGAQGVSGSHISVTNSPITTSGTLSIGIENGYSIPSTANQTTWSNAIRGLTVDSFSNPGIGATSLTPDNNKNVTLYLDDVFAYNNKLLLLNANGDAINYITVALDAESGVTSNLALITGGYLNLVLPSTSLSNNYAPSTDTNENLTLEAGDTYEEAFAKLEKTINDNETITAAALTDLDERIPTKTSDLTNDSGFITQAPVTSVNGQTGAVSLALGDTNIIETVKINGTALTPDANKAVDISVPYTVYVNVTKTNDTYTANKTYTEITTAISNGAAVFAIYDDYIYLYQGLYDSKYWFLFVCGMQATNNIIERIESNWISIDNLNSVDLRKDSVAPLRAPENANINIIPTLTRGTSLAATTATINSNGHLTANKLITSGGKSSQFLKGDGSLDSTAYGTYSKPSGGIPSSDLANSVQTSLSKADTALQSFTETDPTVPAWAKQSTKPSYTAEEVGALPDDYTPPVTSVNGQTGAVNLTIPSAVTESTVSGWGFTKNTGTYNKPSTGIPKSDLADTVQTSLGKADTALLSFTETDPTVPAWAKATNKPTYTAAEVGALPDTYTPPVQSVNGQTGVVNLTIPSAPGTLNTTATTAQSTSSSEALSGNITLHKVAKTGTYGDLIGAKTKLSEFTNDSSYIANNTFYNTITLRSTTTTLNSEDIILQTGANKIELNPTGLTYRDTKHFLFDDAVITTDIEGGVDAHWSTLNDSQLLSAAVIKTKLDELPTVNNATLTIQKNGTTVNTFTANASSNVTANILVNELPTVSSSDNGKILQVVNGAWSLVTPVTVYTGTSTPNNSLGNNGDLYVLTS